MAEWTTGLYRLVAVPNFYNVFQNALGARAGRQRLVNEFIRPAANARVLDLGCGSAVILEALPETVRYVGIDHNPNHIAAARRAFGHRGAFHAGNFAEAASFSEQPYDLVLALGLLHHLEDEEVIGLMQLVHGLLAPSGRLLTVDPVFEIGQSSIARMLIRKDSGRNVRDEQGYVGLARQVFSVVESSIRHDLLRVPYTHCALDLRISSGK